MSFIDGYGSGSGIFAEIQNRIAQMRQDRFAAADTDGSGGVSLEEFEAGASESPFAARLEAQGISASDTFATLDVDGDGELTQSEIEAGDPLNNGSLSSELMSMMLSLQEGEGSRPPPPPPPPPGGQFDLSELLSSDDDDEDESDENSVQNPVDMLIDAFSEVIEGGVSQTYDSTV